MRVALHPYTRSLLDATAYEIAFGKPVDSSGQKRNRPDALCAVCSQGVYLRAEHSKNRVANFAHRRNSKFCPVKDFNATNYRALNPAPGNLQAADKLRKDFFATWKHHWVEFDRVIGYASIYDFCAVLTYADQNGIWHYRGMRVQDVLPVLMTLMDFPPLPKQKRKLRDYGVRFFYEGHVASTDQYWNLPAHQRSLLIVKYDFPGTTRTFQEMNVSDRAPVVFEPAYLAGHFGVAPDVNEFVATTMEKKFPNDV
ncbi:DUF7830 domain-containing protein [Pseudomonas syringae]|uniref:DUF7830 domain-containing protein n=1 Tax=Pseudomonas syringae TaxID=317 RepID=UPI0032048873